MASIPNLNGLNWADLYNEAQSYTRDDEHPNNMGWGPSRLIQGAYMGLNPNGTIPLSDNYSPDGRVGYLFQKPDGSVGYDSYQAQDTFLQDMAKFAAMATGMYAGVGALGGAGASGAGGAAAGAGAAGAGEAAAGGLTVDAGGMGLTGAGGIGSASSVSGAGAGAAGYGVGGAGMASGALSGIGDFLGSKAGSAALGGLLGGVGSSGPNSSTTTGQNKIDPRMDPYIYGENGILPKIMQNLNSSQAAGLSMFGNGMQQYLLDNGAKDYAKTQAAAQNLQGSSIGAPTMAAAQVNAPSQNNLNLSPAFNQMIYGDSAQNPYLQGALQKGVNQANTAFQNMAHDYGQSLQGNLAGIRGGAIVNGSMGSSRQGIAEGKAFDGYNTGMSRALSQYGQNVTDSILGAQANSYENGQNRALSAMQGLNGSQYGTAMQNAAFQQQANQANLQSQLNTNALNSDNQRAGVGLSSGLLGQAYNYGTNADSYSGNKLSQTAGLLGNFTGLNSTQTATTPLYNNTAGGILGGAVGGLALYNAFNPKQSS